MKVRCFDIEWETDGEAVELPTEDVVELPDDTDINDDNGMIADALSDKHGWLVLAAGAEILEAESHRL